ncbi:MAG: glycosyltransferase family 4 protein [Thermodesulfobacteriota bacterium]
MPAIGVPASERRIEFPIDMVLLLEDLEFGGTQRYAMHLLKHLDRSLFSPRLWVLRGGADMEHLARMAGVEPLWLSRNSWVGPRAISRLAYYLATQPPFILYTMTVVPNIWGRLFGSIVRVPVIISTWRGMYPKQFEIVLGPHTARLICNAHVLKEIIIARHAVPPSRIAVIPNGVDPDFFSPAPEEKTPYPSAAYVGRLVDDKDPLTLLEGFRLALLKVPEARFVVAGNGYVKPEVERFVRDHRLGSKIRVLPGVTEVRPILRRSWVFVMSSVREACPNAALEAMACGMPVVASRVGGLPELVQDGITGRLFESRNPEALAEALADLLLDSEKRISMGERARERILEHHSLEQMTRNTEQEILKAVEENRSHPPRRHKLFQKAFRGKPF